MALLFEVVSICRTILPLTVLISFFLAFLFLFKFAANFFKPFFERKNITEGSYEISIPVAAPQDGDDWGEMFLTVRVDEMISEGNDPLVRLSEPDGSPLTPNHVRVVLTTLIELGVDQDADSPGSIDCTELYEAGKLETYGQKAAKGPNPNATISATANIPEMRARDERWMDFLANKALYLQGVKHSPLWFRFFTIYSFVLKVRGAPITETIQEAASEPLLIAALTAYAIYLACLLVSIFMMCRPPAQNAIIYTLIIKMIALTALFVGNSCHDLAILESDTKMIAVLVKAVLFFLSLPALMFMIFKSASALQRQLLVQLRYSGREGNLNSFLYFKAEDTLKKIFSKTKTVMNSAVNRYIALAKAIAGVVTTNKIKTALFAVLVCGVVLASAKPIGHFSYSKVSGNPAAQSFLDVTFDLNYTNLLAQHEDIRTRVTIALTPFVQAHNYSLVTQVVRWHPIERAYFAVPSGQMYDPSFYSYTKLFNTQTPSSCPDFRVFHNESLTYPTNCPSSDVDVLEIYPSLYIPKSTHTAILHATSLFNLYVPYSSRALKFFAVFSATAGFAGAAGWALDGNCGKCLKISDFNAYKSLQTSFNTKVTETFAKLFGAVSLLDQFVQKVEQALYDESQAWRNYTETNFNRIYSSAAAAFSINAQSDLYTQSVESLSAEALKNDRLTDDILSAIDVENVPFKHTNFTGVTELALQFGSTYASARGLVMTSDQNPATYSVIHRKTTDSVYRVYRLYFRANALTSDYHLWNLDTVADPDTTGCNRYTLDSRSWLLVDSGFNFFLRGMGPATDLYCRSFDCTFAPVREVSTTASEKAALVSLPQKSGWYSIPETFYNLKEIPIQDCDTPREGLIYQWFNPSSGIDHFCFKRSTPLLYSYIPTSGSAGSRFTFNGPGCFQVQYNETADFELQIEEVTIRFRHKIINNVTTVEWPNFRQVPSFPAIQQLSSDYMPVAPPDVESIINNHTTINILLNESANLINDMTTINNKIANLTFTPTSINFIRAVGKAIEDVIGAVGGVANKLVDETTKLAKNIVASAKDFANAIFGLESLGPIAIVLLIWNSILTFFVLKDKCCKGQTPAKKLMKSAFSATPAGALAKSVSTELDGL